MICHRCGRTLKNPTSTGYGPSCARAIFGTQPRRPRLFDKGLRKHDARQGALFEERAS